MKLDEIDLKLLRRTLIGQIFPSTPVQNRRLSRMYRAGYVTSRVALYPGGGHAPVYGITPAGRAALELTTTCPRPKTGRCGERWSNEPPCPYRPGPGCATSSS